MADKYLYFGGVKMPAPMRVTMSNEKIWSQNAGRSSSGRFTGDIIAIKKTIHIEWADLTPAQMQLINSYISSTSRALFNVKFPDECFNEVTKKVYASSPSYEQWGWDTRRQLCKVCSVDLIEQ